jgi:hypothetical protein
MGFKGYPKIYHVDNEECDGLFEGAVVIQEKYDGSNIRWKVEEDGTLLVGGHFWTEDERPDLMQKYTSEKKEKINSYWLAREFIRKKIQQADADPVIYMGKVFFGEFIGKVNRLRIDYGVDIDVILYDIWDEGSERFDDAPWVNLQGKLMGFRTPKVYAGRDWEDALKDIKERKREGVVIKNYEKQIFGKVVLEQFKETMSQQFKSNRTDFEWMLAEETVTQARVRKWMEKGRTEYGMSWNHQMIPYLLENVYRDVILEQLATFVLQMKKCKVMDFWVLRKQVVKRTVSTFEEILAVRRLEGQ